MISILAMKSIFLIWHSIVCHDALSFKTSTHHLVQKVEVFKKGWEIGMSGKDFFWKKRNFLDFLDFFLRVMGKLTITIQFFLHEMQSIYIQKIFSRQLLLRYLNNYFVIKKNKYFVWLLWFIEYVFKDNKRWHKYPFY